MNVASYKKLSDDEIIKIICDSNNSLVFGVLYDRYSQIVYNKCLGFTKDKDDAKDLTQEVFIKLFFKLKDYQSQSKFKAWLYVFVYNICINYVNRDKHHNQLKSKAPVYELESLAVEEVSDSVVFELKVEALDKLLMQISPEDKTILLLKYQDELTVSELSKVYGIGESAIKMRIKRAKEKLVKLKNLND
ncbi:RNA polymerase sigma factor [Polaribacter sp. Z014]|uniref:RNA polymerase sigma factor n=1 Tax=Polaribacter sp. Z014 TaxID=2927126 RepID=UPI002021D573|nr:RNA polymerase sigma factor [Polaribacter sp. Z014]MCL7763657.1 RNA polymerase sigma factor [Polaribacter sp. Z014]